MDSRTIHRRNGRCRASSLTRLARLFMMSYFSAFCASKSGDCRACSTKVCDGCGPLEIVARIIPSVFCSSALSTASDWRCISNETDAEAPYIFFFRCAVDLDSEHARMKISQFAEQRFMHANLRRTSRSRHRLLRQRH